MTYAPICLVIALTLLVGCHSTDPRTRRIATGEAEKVLSLRFEERADDYVEAKVTSWAGWLAAAAGAAGLAGGGGMLKAWQGARKGGKA